MHRNTHLEANTPNKWKKDSDFNIPHVSPFPDARNERGYKLIRKAMYRNTFATLRHDIYIYAYDRFKGLELTYFICNRELARKFESTCSKSGLNIKINDDYFTQIYTFASNDKFLLTAFINAIDEVDPLFEIKDEVIDIVNTQFIFTVKELEILSNQTVEVENKGKNNNHNGKIKLTFFPIEDAEEFTNLKKLLIDMLHTSHQWLELNLFWPYCEEFNKKIAEIMLWNTKVCFTNDYLMQHTLDLKTIGICSQRNKSLNQYPHLDSIIKEAYFKAGFYKPSVFSKTPANLSVLATLCLIKNKENIENYSDLITNLPSELKDSFLKLESITNLKIECSDKENISGKIL